MNKKQRIKIEVYVDLDDLPGAFSTKESATIAIGSMLQNQIPHYNPRVYLTAQPRRLTNGK